MAAKIQLTNERVFVVEEPFEDVEKAYQDALAVNGVFRITNGAGKVHLVSAAQVAVIENLPEGSAQDQEQAAAQVR